MEYRREIDGLRAVAVLPVIFFHAGFDLFSGGYVGVDVFFVISGYLITTIILSEKEKGTFSLVTFYERRARRILPALFLVMLASTLFAWLWLQPSHMKDFSESLAAVSVFSSNILFWQETGYWGVENELKPLLHTWSLAVEEQYYVFFPLFLMLMWRFRKRWILSSFFFIAIASFIYSQWASVNNPTANFFLLTTRAWELAIGAGIAFYFLYRKQAIRSLISHKTVDELFSILGIGLIAYAVFAFDENTPFPGIYALGPTMGAALLIIFSSKDTFIGKILGSKIPVGLGLLSYSAYLWHQPLFAFARHRSLQEPSFLLLITLSFISLFLAFISWKYVETPFRRKGIFSKKQVFSYTILASSVFIVFGLAGHITEGYSFRVDKTLASAIESATRKSFSEKMCAAHRTETENDYCVLASKKAELTFLFGDSHAETLAYEAQRAFDTNGYGLLSATKSACPPVKGVYRVDKPDNQSCHEHNNRIFNYIENSTEIEYVILSARWTLGMEGTRFDNNEGGIEHGRKPHLDIIENGKYLYHESYQHQEKISQAYINSIQSLLDAGKKVILVYPIPEAGWNVPDYISRYHWVDPESAFSQSTASTSHKVFSERNKKTIDALNKIKAEGRIIRIFPEKIFCNNSISGRCITQKDGVIFYRDEDHLSDAGAKLIVESIIRHLNRS